METIVVSAILVVSLLLVLQMLGHVSLWWRLEEDRCERTAAARHALGKINDLLFMAGYQPSIKGIHAMGRSSLSVEFLVEGAEQSPGEFTRHRLYTVRQDGSQLKLVTQRRRLPLDGSTPWGEGSTSILAEGVRELSFRYLAGTGRETDRPEDVRMVVFTLHLDAPSTPKGSGDQCYCSAVFLRNHHG